jgi:hypothetical protein
VENFACLPRENFMERTRRQRVLRLQRLPEGSTVIVSKHSSLRAALGVLTVAVLVSAGSILTGDADILHFDPSRGSLLPLSHGAPRCWEWSAGVKDWTSACRVGAYGRAYPVNPLQVLPPVSYDYPSYGPGISGSSLSFVVGRSGPEQLRPPAHAD